jgi:hypothetical protein
MLVHTNKNFDTVLNRSNMDDALTKKRVKNYSQKYFLELSRHCRCDHNCVYSFTVSYTYPGGH